MLGDQDDIESGTAIGECRITLIVFLVENELYVDISIQLDPAGFSGKTDARRNSRGKVTFFAAVRIERNVVGKNDGCADIRLDFQRRSGLL